MNFWEALVASPGAELGKVNILGVVQVGSVQIEIWDAQFPILTCEFCNHPGCRYMFTFKDGRRSYTLGPTCGPRFAQAFAEGKLDSVLDIPRARVGEFAARAEACLQEALTLQAKLQRLRLRQDKSQATKVEALERIDRLNALKVEARERQSQSLWDIYNEFKRDCQAWAETQPKGLRVRLRKLFQGYLPSPEQAEAFLSGGELERKIATLEQRAQALQSGKAYLYS